MTPPYRFPGITDFVAEGGVKPSFAVKIPGLFFVGRVVDALSQIPTVEPRHRAAMYAVADEALVALRAAVVTAEAAYAHVRAACPTPEEIAEAQARAAKAKAAPTAAPVKEKPLAGA